MSKSNKFLSPAARGTWMIAAVAAAGLSIAAGGQHARATITPLGSFTLHNYDAGDGTSTNALNATVDFAYNSSGNYGNLDVTITNNSTPLSDAELIRNVLFQASNGSTAITPSGPTTVNLPNGATEINGSDYSSLTTTSVPVGSSGQLNRTWVIGTSSYSTPTGSYWNLAASTGGQPTDYVGPTAGSGNYTNYQDANPSVYQHLPAIAGPVTFGFNIAGLQSTSAISNVYVGYGTSSAITSEPLIPSSSPVPEPAALGLFAVGGLGLLMLKRRKTA